jgi:hypothetical protein
LIYAYFFIDSCILFLSIHGSTGLPGLSPRRQASRTVNRQKGIHDLLNKAALHGSARHT